MKIGLIGCGRMGSALILGILARKICRPPDVMAHDPDARAIEALRQAAKGVRVAKSNAEAAAHANAVLVCVKPPDVAHVVAEAGRSAKDALFISIAAGVKIDSLERAAGPQQRVVRVMPNTPALIGHGASAYALGTRTKSSDAGLVEKLFGAVGTVVRVPEKSLDAVTGLSGSGPAFVYTVIEALADGGVLAGLPRDVALSLAAQTVTGAAEMVRQTGQHPAVLRDQVTSPGGTTAAGMAVLEDRRMRSAFIEAVRAATVRSIELGR
jgi:pyrroline-5-carboxylate reductase